MPQFAIHLFQNVVPLEVRQHDDAPRALRRRSSASRCSRSRSRRTTTAPFALGTVYTYVFGLLAAALITLARRGQRSPSRAVRDRVRFLVVVGAAATTFSMADFLSYLGVHLPPIGAVLAIVFLFVLAESLTRPRLADIYELAGRLLVSTALAFCLAGIFYLFVMVIGGFDTMYLNAVLAAIVFLVLFEPLQTEVETRIHQFFFRERYDLETSVADLRRRLAHVLEIDEMVDDADAGPRALAPRDDGGALPARPGRRRVRPRRARSARRCPSASRRSARGRCSTGWRSSRRCRSRSSRARRNKADARGARRRRRRSGALQSAVVLACAATTTRCVGLLFVADDRVRDAFTPEEIALLETRRRADRRRRRQQPRLLAHEGARPPRGARLDGRRPRARGEEPARRHQGRRAAARGGGRRARPTTPRRASSSASSSRRSNRLDRVVGSFLDYARPHAGNPIPLDLNAAVRRTVQIVSSQITDGGIDVQLDLGEPLPRAQIDPEKFRQVLMNLMQNAIQAMDGRGKITVTTQMRRARAGAGARRSTAAIPSSRRSLADDAGARSR